MLPPLSTAGWVDLSIGDSLFGEKEQARLLAGEQLRLLGRQSIALACYPCQAQTKPQLRSCKSWNPGGQLPYKLAHQAGIVSAQTCQTHSQPGWPPQGVTDSTGQSGNSSNGLSNNSQRSNPSSFLQTEMPTMTPWMCWGTLVTPLS